MSEAGGVRRPPSGGAVIGLTVVLAGYLLGATWLCYRGGMAVGNDQTSYLYLASELAAGRLATSFSGQWSPLITWLIAAGITVGADPVQALYLWGIVGGAAWVVGAWCLTGRYGLGVGARTVLAVAVALWAACFAAHGSAADLLLAASLSWYMVAATAPRLALQARYGVAVGLVAALAYFAKAYALPFVLVHYPLSCVLRARLERPAEGVTQRRYLHAWVLGTAVMVLVAAPWIAVLSARYGRLTVSTVPYSTWRQYEVGTDEGRWYQRGLHAPAPGVLSVWVDPAAYEQAHPDETPVRLTWAKRVRFFAGNVLELRDKVVRRLDVAGLVPAALCLVVVVVAGRLRPPPKGGLEWPAWTLLTFVAYVSGYLLTGVPVERYYLPAWMLLLINALAMAHWGQRLLAGHSRMAGRLLGLLVAGSLIVGGLNVVADQARHRGPGTEQALGRQLQALSAAAPLAVAAHGYTSSGRETWSTGLAIAYWAGLQYLGVPNATEPQPVAAKLEAAGVRTFLVRPEDPAVRYLAGRAKWHRAGQIAAAGQGGQPIRYEVLICTP